MASNPRRADSGGDRAALLGQEQAAQPRAQDMPSRRKPPRPSGGCALRRKCP